MDFGIDNLPELIRQVDDKLIKVSSSNIPGVSNIVGAGGKKYRPRLVLAVAHLCGKQIDDDVINAATAIELIHTASLVHDDIMDGGSLRWGKPTINSIEGNNVAILAGDYLFAKGCYLASLVSAEAAGIITDAFTQLCNGQALEIADNFNTERSVESLNAAIKGKTSAMFAASCVMGGLLAGMAKTQMDILAQFAENYGIAYQYMDDVLDFTASPDQAGKSLGNDVIEGNYTLPVILSLQGKNKDELKELLEQKTYGPKILKILQEDGSLDQTAKEAEKYKQKALSELEKLDNSKLSGALKTFVGDL